jgi:anti-sigma B factor antagonist
MATKAHRLDVTQDLTIYTAADSRQLLIDAIKAGDLLELDLSHVEEMDSAGIQLLIMAKRECERLGRDLRIVAHSPAVRQTIDFCNLATYFGDPVVISANEKV